MKVFEYVSNSNIYSIPFDWDEEDRNIDYVDAVINNYFDKRQKVGEDWCPDFFGIVNKQMKLGDLGSLTTDEMVIMSSKSVEALKPLIEKSVEFLPYPTEVGNYYLVNVLDEGAYLDRELTECGRRMENGICREISKYSFHEDALYDKHIFRIPDRPTSRFVSGEFINVCLKYDLRGIHLAGRVELWES